MFRLVFAIMAVVLCAVNCDNMFSGKSTYVIPDTKANWMGAGEYCNRNGMRLAVITSDANNRVVLDLIHKAKVKDSKLANVWIGASDMSKEGTFVWQSTGLPISYNDWAPTQPDNWQKNEHCAEIANRGYTKWTWSWNDLRCDTVQNFVCESTQRYEIVEF